MIKPNCHVACKDETPSIFKFYPLGQQKQLFSQFELFIITSAISSSSTKMIGYDTILFVGWSLYLADNVRIQVNIQDVYINMGMTSSKTVEQVKVSFKEVFQEIRYRLANYSFVPQDTRRQNNTLLVRCMDTQLYRRSLGCLFGSLIGDALGAYCQFQTSPLSDDLLFQTMEMKGKGVFKLYPGQFTDDSEMAYHMLKGLTKLNPHQKVTEQFSKILLQIAKEYASWGSSKPFDMGITCRKGIDVIANCKVGNVQGREESKLNNILEQVKLVNGNSQSNGSLMRIAPMGIFFALINQNPQTHEAFIKNQIGLIHCNEVLKEAGFIWVKVLFNLIKRKDSNQQTYRGIFQEAERSARNEEVKIWFKQAKSSPMSANENMGWAKIAWTYGMNVLYRLGSGREYGFNYFNEIKEVVGRGGDSDTNAAIVGGLLGAVVDFKELPGRYLRTIFSLTFPELPEQERKLIDRPKHYEPTNVLAEMLNLIRVTQKYKNSNSHHSPSL